MPSLTERDLSIPAGGAGERGENVNVQQAKTYPSVYAYALPRDLITLMDSFTQSAHPTRPNESGLCSAREEEHKRDLQSTGCVRV